MVDISIEEQISCVKRELGMRHSVYERRVRDGKMTQEKADKEIAGMEAVMATLQKVAQAGRLI